MHTAKTFSHLNIVPLRKKGQTIVYVDRISVTMMELGQCQKPVNRCPIQSRDALLYCNTIPGKLVHEVFFLCKNFAKISASLVQPISLIPRIFLWQTSRQQHSTIHQSTFDYKVLQCKRHDNSTALPMYTDMHLISRRFFRAGGWVQNAIWGGGWGTKREMGWGVGHKT